MSSPLRRLYWHVFVPNALPLPLGLQVFVLGIGLALKTRDSLMLALAMVALTSLIASLAAFRRAHALRATPTSRIGTAKQGYIQLAGHARALPEAPPLYTARTQTPCVWYRYMSTDRWKNLVNTESETPFILDDGTGQCIIDPSDVDVRTTRKESWRLDGRRYTEWSLLIGDPIEAVGEFRTFGGPPTSAEVHDEVSRILAAAKHDMPRLLRHFDRDGDGQLNAQEWARVHQAAERKAIQELQTRGDQTRVNRLIKPQDGRPFLVSNQSRRALVHVYWFWGTVQLCILMGALVALVESGWLFELEERAQAFLRS